MDAIATLLEVRELRRQILLHPDERPSLERRMDDLLDLGRDSAPPRKVLCAQVARMRVLKASRR